MISMYNMYVIRLYVKYLRNLAEKTDLGRLAGPSLLRLVDEALSISGRRPLLNGNMSAEIWDAMDRMLEVIIIPILLTQQFDVDPIGYVLPLPCREDLQPLQNLINLAAFL